MRYKILQKQGSPRNSLKTAGKFFFFQKEMISCYNVLQQVTMRYKRLQKIGMCTTFNITQEIFFLKEGEKLLWHVTTSYNALQDITETAQSKDKFENFSKVLFFLKEGMSC